MNEFCTDVGYVSLNKWGEQPAETRWRWWNRRTALVVVLADGWAAA